KRLESARKLSQRGRFAEAEEQLAAAAALRPDLKLIEDKRQVCKERADRSRALHEQLHAAMAASDWTKVLACANELIEIAPENRVAREARKRAWAEVGEQIGDSRRLGETKYGAATPHSGATLVNSSAAPAKHAPRFMLWIDAVGG